MATLILGTVGRIFGGPIGGLIGTAVGGIVDQGLFGGGAGREVGRISNLAVQSAAYGEPLPIIIGRMRAAGNLIWTSGIKESSTRSGGGKRGGTATTTYSYAASFAVGLAARAIAGVGRIWADGKLIRGSDGVFLTPIVMRLHGGDEGQAVDPLIAAAEGADGTPAYNGLAYAVFEDLPLADYGNRIPNLNFEIIADAGDAIDAGLAVRAVAAAADRVGLATIGDFPALAGFVAGRSGSVSDAIAPLLAIIGASVETTDGLVIRGGDGAVATVPAADCDAAGVAETRVKARRKRSGPDLQAAAMEIGFYDTSRDFQAGLQRVRRRSAGPVDQKAVSAAMAPSQAKALAARLLARGEAGRSTMTLRLPWRHVGVGPGGLVSIAGESDVWQVREARFEGFVVNLDLVRFTGTAPAVAASDGGRVLAFDDSAAGPTMLQLLDLPPLPGDLPDRPRLWVAAAGAAGGWRRAGIAISQDDGTSYAPLGSIEGGTVLGQALTALPPGSGAGWDRFASVDVELVSAAMWLEGRPEASVLAGSNMALIGDEIVQFAVAEAIGPQRFRLSKLLRGQRGTEAAIFGHGSRERFVLLDAPAMLAFDPALEMIGRTARARAFGSGDAATPAVSAAVTGRALRPLAPVHLRIDREGDDLAARWVRRSRAGFGWTDFVDAPLGEASEAYRVTVVLDGRMVRTISTAAPQFAYPLADRLADGGGAEVAIGVAQTSAAVGPGESTWVTIRLA